MTVVLQLGLVELLLRNTGGKAKLSPWDARAQAGMRMKSSSSRQKKTLFLMDGGGDDKLPRKGTLKEASLAGMS